MSEIPLLRENSPQPSILFTLGEEIVRIIIPVSSCMLLVVLLVTILDTDSIPDLSSILADFSSASASVSVSSIWDDLKGALITSAIFIAMITAVTFLIVVLFYFRFNRFLKSYMIFSSFIVLSLLGGQICLYLISVSRLPLDSITFFLLFFNFSVVGTVAIVPASTSGGMPLIITQLYLIWIAVIVAYWFTHLPEWTTWALLVSLAVYDIAAVLLPGGPLRLLVELAISRNEELPALVYEARPVNVAASVGDRDGVRRRLWRASEHEAPPNSDSGSSSVSVSRNCLIEEDSSESAIPLNGQIAEEDSELNPEGRIGLGTSGAIKLGLGDFIFYSVLVGRVALYDFMGVYACYLAIMGGLGVTLLLLAFYRKALPALPVSIGLGLLFYVATRFLLEEFVTQCSVSLIMF